MGAFGKTYLLHDDGTVTGPGMPKYADARLAESGQRVKGGVWPEGHGVVEIEDIPKPEPLPTAYLSRNLISGGLYWDALLWPNYTRIATVTFDADDNATVVRHP